MEIIGNEGMLAFNGEAPPSGFQGAAERRHADSDRQEKIAKIWGLRAEEADIEVEIAEIGEQQDTIRLHWMMLKADANKGGQSGTKRNLRKQKRRRYLAEIRALRLEELDKSRELVGVYVRQKKKRLEWKRLMAEIARTDARSSETQVAKAEAHPV